MVTVICVLKSGGIYGPDYVANLKTMVSRHLAIPYHFVCLTDMDIEGGGRLANGWPGWWSKIEIFRFGGKAIYLDLDTAIFGDLTSLADALDRDGAFYMLRPFARRERWASGIMAWNGDFSFIFREFRVHHIAEWHWDQRYIVDRLDNHEVQARAIQDVLPGIYSYKKHCNGNPPADARVVCFHGKPRPHEVGMPYWEMGNAS